MSELGFVSTAADTLIVTALAGTLFFSVSATAARERVATSLLVTMVPFVLLAPVIGPLLDHVRSGRRYAMATTMLARAFLAWVMADAVTGGSMPFSLYPEAFGFLLFQKAYLVTRSAAVPRVLPPGTTLVTANSRISLAGVVSMTVRRPDRRRRSPMRSARRGRCAWRSSSFAAATVLAVALPARVDSSAGEERAGLTAGLPDGDLRGWRAAPDPGPASRASGPGGSSPCARARPRGGSPGSSRCSWRSGSGPIRCPV